jgi:hypothetical protein
MPEEIQMNNEPGIEAEAPFEFAETPAPDYGQMMEEQEIITQENNGEFFAQTPIGDVSVRLATENEAFMYQAEEVGEREEEVKTELENTNATVEEQLVAAKKTMAENDAAFTEAKKAEEILNQLRQEGKLLVVDGAIINEPEFSPGGKFFVISADNLDKVQLAFTQEGYGVRKIEGKGLTVEGPFASYNFILTSFYKKKERQAQEEEDDDLGDEAERRISGEKNKTQSGKLKAKSAKGGRAAKGSGPKAVAGRRTKTSNGAGVSAGQADALPAGIAEPEVFEQIGALGTLQSAATIETLPPINKPAAAAPAAPSATPGPGAPGIGGGPGIAGPGIGA